MTYFTSGLTKLSIFLLFNLVQLQLKSASEWRQGDHWCTWIHMLRKLQGSIYLYTLQHRKHKHIHETPLWLPNNNNNKCSLLSLNMYYTARWRELVIANAKHNTLVKFCFNSNSRKYYNSFFFFINKPLGFVVARAVFVAVSLPIFSAVHLVVSA